MLTFTIQMVQETCCNCGIVFGMTQDLYKRRKSDGKGFYCPNGHEQYYTESTERKLKKQIESLKREKEENEEWWSETYDRVAEERDDAKKDAKVAKCKLTKTMNRVKNGVCPCCNRHFENLQEHMKSKHPETT